MDLSHTHRWLGKSPSGRSSLAASELNPSASFGESAPALGFGVVSSFGIPVSSLTTVVLAAFYAIAMPIDQCRTSYRPTAYHSSGNGPAASSSWAPKAKGRHYGYPGSVWNAFQTLPLSFARYTGGPRCVYTCCHF
jgi:hypothetical protein